MKRDFNQNIPIYNNKLYEIVLLKSGEREYYLYGKFHHLINDGWGISLLVQKVAEIYNKYITNEELDAKTYSYLNFIKRNTEYKNSNDYSKDFKRLKSFFVLAGKMVLTGPKTVPLPCFP